MVRTKKSAWKIQCTNLSPSPPRVNFHEDFPAFNLLQSDFSKCEVLLDHVFDLELLGEAKFSFLTTLRSKKWLPLLELKTPVLLYYVCMFYSNAQSSFNGHDYSDRFQTFMQNSEFEFTPKTLAQFLEILDKGAIYVPHKLNSLKACKTIFKIQIFQSPSRI